MSIAIGDTVAVNGETSTVLGINSYNSRRYLSLADGRCVNVAFVNQHTPSTFNQVASLSRTEQNKFLKQHHYEWHFYSAQFAEDNDDFGGGDEWILYGPDGNAVELLDALRSIYAVSA